ncbi:carbamoyltransferase C-terminal domain-containing protein [Candidatus Magnetomonas plexicatena]|uniref:carbamoyltransferase C-terminal domain-containing protein n=1 Tax=Candidatus Magnetomonas plexicatena TaxID=2552947 RepID=UPI001C766659|nr:hypothetical protein E2O03_009965 [Nitrospirales bacterium LBB_01]
MYILGIWDGHDAGAAILKDNKVLTAINEERLSRRKLEAGFPALSIKACLNALNLEPRDIDCISSCTTDFSKTLTRAFPSLKEQYYLIRRRKIEQGAFQGLKKRAKYVLTEIGPSALSTRISRHLLTKELKRLGFKKIDFHQYGHHDCHAAAAAFCSRHDKSLVVTLDGIGDGLSGNISVLDNDRLSLIKQINGRDSFGIFFEHVTNLLNMRELEDEGKVMALADYAYPIDDDKNPMLEFFQIDGLNVSAKYGSLQMFNKLKKILWQYPSEQFAYMAERVLEVHVVQLIKNALTITACDKVALAGGVFSNIVVNMLISELSGVSNCFIYPHMGDGGLAAGAAMCANYELNSVSKYDFNDVFWGTGFKDTDITDALKTKNLKFEKKTDIAKETAKLISEGHIVFWFQGAMEYGPRALGRRSILALPNSEEIKNRLNLRLKMRVWYQPFCPSILKEDFDAIIDRNGSNTYNKFMAMGYRVKPEFIPEMKGIVSLRGVCRPQVVDESDGVFYNLLSELKKITGRGVLLNTSFNIHGQPLVFSPEDAVKTLITAKNRYMAIGDYLVENENYA